MTNYAEITLGAVVSTSDDYQPATHRWGPKEATSTPVASVENEGTVAVAGLTIPLSYYTTIEAFMCQNTGETNSLIVTYEDDTTATQQVVAPGKMILLASIDKGTDIVVSASAGTTTFESLLLVTT